MGIFDGSYTGNDFNNTFKAHKKGIWPIKRWGSWTMYGKKGNDTLTGGPKNDYIHGGAGYDILSGGDGDDTLLGRRDNDTLHGGNGNDYLDGGPGSDRMYGGFGNDTFIVDNVGDRVIEYSYQGVDTVKSSISYTLGNYVENLTLTGSAYSGYGNFHKNIIKGNNYNNFLRGWAGNDSVYGYGGNDYLFGDAGNDFLDGGFGNDVLLGGTGKDTLIGGGGNDRLTGYNGTTGEYDTLIGDFSGSKPGIRNTYDGSDTFILGNRSSAFYQGAGYATIKDFNRGEGDIIELHGRRSDYSLGTANYGGTSAFDTGIFYKGDLIGVVQDTTNVSLYAGTKFV